jgi:hypothetical protein
MNEIASCPRQPLRRIHRILEQTKLLSSSPNSIISNGGIFNNYQAVPLSQGYGTHFANVWVGTPTPQRKTVIVDTGSHYTAFPCTGCVKCGAPHHTDPYFRPENSITFQRLQCNECQDGVACENGKWYVISDLSVPPLLALSPFFLTVTRITIIIAHSIKAIRKGVRGRPFR